MTTVRCSALDRAFACNLSLLPTGSPYNPTSQEATEGRAAHEALSYLPQGARPPLDEIAAKYGVDADDLARHVASGRRALEDLQPHLRLGESRVLVEQQMESELCRGTGDLIILRYDRKHGDERESLLDTMFVVDWKTGWGRDLHPKQLRGYAHLAVERFGWPASGTVTLFEVWTAHRQTETTNLDREALAAFVGELRAIKETVAISPDKIKASPGEHCKYCPRRVGCAARERWLRDAVTALVMLDPGEAITHEVLGHVYERAQEIGRALRKFDKIMDAALEEGDVPLPDGRLVTLAPQPREKISAGPAVRLLAERLTREQLDDLLGDLSKAALERMAKAVSPPRKGRKTLGTWLEMLRESGAVRDTVEQRKTVVGPENS